MTLEEAQALFEPAVPYLNTASYGLPPRPAWEALQAALADWHGGRTSWEHWGESTERARGDFAELVSMPVERVAVGATVSELVGLVAASFPSSETVSRGVVVAPDVEFTSLLWPWLAQGYEVVTAPVAGVADAIDERTSVVAVSAVQSSSGEVADLEAIVAAARARDAIVVVDATQAASWLPIDASQVDALACAGYKWLLAPRGTAYLTLGDRLVDRVKPAHAGWYAAEDVHGSYYGPPLALARDTRRLDTSPAWFSWVGAAPALEVILAVGVDAIHDHNVGLANRFRAGLGLEPGNSAIVSADVDDAHERLERAGIRAATRAGSLRASFHLYTTEADVDAALDALVT
jgi:selenocysteine lyase/cysteine desulfurase